MTFKEYLDKKDLYLSLRQKELISKIQEDTSPAEVTAMFTMSGRCINRDLIFQYKQYLKKEM